MPSEESGNGAAGCASSLPTSVALIPDSSNWIKSLEFTCQRSLSPASQAMNVGKDLHLHSAQYSMRLATQAFSAQHDATISSHLLEGIQ